MTHFYLVAAIFLVALMTSATQSRGQAEAPALTVVPWNGYPAAVSLTFDDGETRCHLDTVIPRLDQRGLKGTFYVINDFLQRDADWAAAYANGHEMGNHSLNHKHAKDLTPELEQANVVDAQKQLAQKLGRPITTWAYPYSEVTPGLKSWVEKTHLAGRGEGRAPYVLKADSEPDWYVLPSRVVKSADTTDLHRQWLDEAIAEKGWLIIMLHSVEGNGWEPITIPTFEAMLDKCKADGFWVATLNDVAAYWKGQKLIEKANVEKLASGGSKYTWTRPDLIPAGVMIKVKTTGKVSQGGKTIEASEGIYSISLDAGELTITN